MSWNMVVRDCEWYVNWNDLYLRTVVAITQEYLVTRVGSSDLQGGSRRACSLTIVYSLGFWGNDGEWGRGRDFDCSEKYIAICAGLTCRSFYGRCAMVRRKRFEEVTPQDANPDPPSTSFGISASTPLTNNHRSNAAHRSHHHACRGILCSTHFTRHRA